MQFYAAALRWSVPFVSTSIALACTAASSEPKKAGERSGGDNSGASANAGGRPNDSNVGGAPSVSLAGTSNGGTAGITECVGVSQVARIEHRPVDIVVVIDNSPSMTDKILSVQQRVNDDLSVILEASKVDYRVILISSYTSKRYAFPICVGAPLGKTNCALRPRPALVDNPPRFFHLDIEVQSSDPWCRLFDSWNTPDDQGRGEGWGKLIRRGAFKSFVLISDGGVGCRTKDGTKRYMVDEVAAGVDTTGGHPATPEEARATAQAFERDLLALSPEQFGTANERNYRVHSIVGLRANEPENKPWAPDEPLMVSIEDVCGPTIAPNLGSQALSVLSSGFRYPVCLSDDFDAIFRAVAEDVTVESKLSCEWAIPAAPIGQKLDLKKINLEYIPEADASARTIPKVANAAACGEESGWYYDDDVKATKVHACPATCTQLKATKEGEVRIAFGCDTISVVK
jgi:hypothetical protein